MMSAPADYDGSSDGARASAVEEDAAEYEVTYKNHVDKKAHAAEKAKLLHSGMYNDLAPPTAGVTAVEVLMAGPPPPPGYVHLIGLASISDDVTFILLCICACSGVDYMSCRVPSWQLPFVAR